MNICFVCFEYPPGPCGGIGTSTQTLARGLVEAGHQVRVVGVYQHDYPAPDYEEDSGVQVWRMRRVRVRGGWVADRWRLHRAVARWVRRRSIDIVDVPDWHGLAAFWPRMRVPVISRACGSVGYFANELQETANRCMLRLESASLRRADFWCSKSEYMASKTQRVFKLPRGADAILYNPVSIPSATDFESRSPSRVTFTGSLVAKKGIARLVDAWPRVRAACPDATLHVYGKDCRTKDGDSMKASLEAMLPADHRDSVCFHGHVPRADVVTALQTTRVAVFPSYAEGFANAPLEAMACGAPTIYSRRGSGPELIDDRQNGLLVEPDSSEQIAAAIIELLQDDCLAEQLGQAGRESVAQRFSLPAVVSKNEAFYTECLNGFHNLS